MLNPSRRMPMIMLALTLGVGLLCLAAPGEAQKTEITVGAALSTTGRFSTEAGDALKAYQLFIEETNAAGGVSVRSLGKRLPLRLVSYDDQSDASTAAKLYERLITTDKVDLLFSPWGSGHNFAVTAVTEKHQFPVVMASAAADSIFNRGFKYIFSTVNIASVMPSAVVSYLKTKRDEIRSVAVLYENFLFTASLRDTLVGELKAAGFNVVADERYPLGGKDFTTLLIKVKSLNPDALLVYNIMPASIYATRQMREVGFVPKFYFVNIGPMFTKEFVEGLGPQSEGVVEFGFWHPDLPYPGAKDFAGRYQAKYGHPPSTDSAYAYMAAQILMQAVEKAGVLERERIAETLRREEFVCIGGKFKYDARGVNLYQKPFLAQVLGGKREIVWPPELTKVQLRFPVFAK